MIPETECLATVMQDLNETRGFQLKQPESHALSVGWLSVGTIIITALLLAYLFRVATLFNHVPKPVLEWSPNRWTRRDILTAYERARRQPVDIRYFLPPSSGRRYVVVGASGLVGGWIVRHLLMRGEAPSAIRMLDIRCANVSKDEEHRVSFMRVDIADEISLKAAFSVLWQADVAHLPLTVFHTAAVIDCGNRARDLLPALAKVNVDGTRNVLTAAREAGASVFISTSSASVSVRAVRWFPWPWQPRPAGFNQEISNAEPARSALETKHEEYCGNYARTKHVAEELVMNADDKAAEFRTGCIRPGNAIYGTGVEDCSSMTWRFLSSGGHPSWAHNCMQNFVDAQNVSVAHLLLESQLVTPTHGRDIGGRAYCVTDPNPPATYGDLYRMLTLLSESPIKFPSVPILVVLCLSYIIEAYITFQRVYARSLPRLAGDILLCQPAVLTASRINLNFDISQTRQDLNYKGPFTTMDGVAASVFVWNCKLRDQRTHIKS